MIQEKRRKVSAKRTICIHKKLLKNKIILMILRKMFLDSEKIVNLFAVQKADNN